MARAKRTDRAAARRRYRATLGEGPDALDLEEEEAPATERAPAAAARRGGSPAASSAGPSQPRPSIAGAFRSSFRPIDLRGDLQALPRLLRHPAFLVPVVLSGLSVALVPLLGVNALTATFYQYFAYTIPIGALFIAGFFSPRASYLVGALVAIASVAFQALAFSAGNFGGVLEGLSDPTTAQPLTRDAAVSRILNDALANLPLAPFVAAAAAWYRRFLNRASPNRARQAAAGKRPDGKVAKRNQQRPILARRR